MNEQRMQCKECGERFSVFRWERERSSPLLAAEVTVGRRAQARARMQALGDRLRTPPGQPASDGPDFDRTRRVMVGTS